VTPAALVAELRARGVTLRPDGELLKVRPISKVSPEELEALRQHKAEVLAILTTPPVPLRLDPVTVCEVLFACDPDPGRRLAHRHPTPDPHDLAILRLDVAGAVARLEAGIRVGQLPPRQLVRGRPLADWLDLAEVARLLRMGAQR
jgi:hypothetical protein